MSRTSFEKSLVSAWITAEFPRRITMDVLGARFFAVVFIFRISVCRGEGGEMIDPGTDTADDDDRPYDLPARTPRPKPRTPAPKPAALNENSKALFNQLGNMLAQERKNPISLPNLTVTLPNGRPLDDYPPYPTGDSGYQGGSSYSNTYRRNFQKVIYIAIPVDSLSALLASGQLSSIGFGTVFPSLPNAENYGSGGSGYGGISGGNSHGGSGAGYSGGGGGSYGNSGYGGTGAGYSGSSGSYTGSSNGHSGTGGSYNGGGGSYSGGGYSGSSGGSYGGGSGYSGNGPSLQTVLFGSGVGGNGFSGGGNSYSGSGGSDYSGSGGDYNTVGGSFDFDSSGYGSGSGGGDYSGGGVGYSGVGSSSYGGGGGVVSVLSGSVSRPGYGGGGYGGGAGSLPCPRGSGYYRHPIDCNRFYRCVDIQQGGYNSFKVYEFNCPAVWVCVWPYQQEAGNCYVAAPPPVALPAPAIPGLIGGSSYGSGGGGYGGGSSFSSGSYGGGGGGYNDDDKIASAAADSDVDSYVETTTRKPRKQISKPVPAVAATSAGKPRCLGVGFFPHPFDCTQFAQCWKSNTGDITGYYFKCPPKTVFNARIPVCDDPANVPDASASCLRKLKKPSVSSY